MHIVTVHCIIVVFLPAFFMDFITFVRLQNTLVFIFVSLTDASSVTNGI